MLDDWIPMDELYALLMLLAANGAPIVAGKLLGRRWDAPLDCGWRLADGRALLGPSKTLRGVVAAVLATMLLGLLLGYPWQLGCAIGGLAMLGDALSSFIKRRLGIASGGMAPGLDHIPESLLPLIACKSMLGLSWGGVLGLSLAFMIANILLSRLLYRLGVRDHPY
ncbi:MAG: CDP-archaeol synthase [Chromatiaceae bacterium]|jgi:hypothetical protein|nr:CDP-archaeol synthase [Chromatiaceae bacterium]